MARPVRQFKRRTVRVLVEYTAATGPCCEVATTLGAGGLFIETEEPLEEGSDLKLRFRVGDRGRSHEIAGRVVWRHRPGDPGTTTPGMGIAFCDPAASADLARELERLP